MESFNSQYGHFAQEYSCLCNLQSAAVMMVVACGDGCWEVLESPCDLAPRRFGCLLAFPVELLSVQLCQTPRRIQWVSPSLDDQRKDAWRLQFSEQGGLSWSNSVFWLDWSRFDQWRYLAEFCARDKLAKALK